jgi:hypothetical protein
MLKVAPFLVWERPKSRTRRGFPARHRCRDDQLDLRFAPARYLWQILAEDSRPRTPLLLMHISPQIARRALAILHRTRHGLKQRDKASRSAVTRGDLLRARRGSRHKGGAAQLRASWFRYIRGLPAVPPNVSVVPRTSYFPNLIGHEQTLHRVRCVTSGRGIYVP